MEKLFNNLIYCHWHKIITILLSSFVLFFVIYHYIENTSTINLLENEVKVSGYTSSLGTVSQIENYLNIDLRNKPERVKELRENMNIINFKWELSSTKAIESYKKNELYFPPYLIIVQPEQWTYLGTGPCPSLMIESVGSLPGEIYENVVNGNLDIEWNSIKNKALIRVIKVKSFEQGYANVAYLKHSNDANIEGFIGYFIYYDPTIKTGWYKQVQF